MADAIITITHPHRLGRAEARSRAESAIRRLARKHSIMGTWHGDVFTATFPAKGTFTVGADAVSVSLQLGSVMAFAKNEIEAEIRRELASSLA